METRIVATSPIGETAIEILEQVARFEVSATPDEETLMGLLEGTIGLVSRGSGRVTARMIEACADLAVIGRPGAGFETVDVEAATARRIPVVYAPVGGFAVAEGALALLLALVKKLPLCDDLVRSGQWQERYAHETGDIAGHTVGILGVGRIGTQFARLMQPFEVSLLGCDPFADPAVVRELGVEMVGLDELLSRSDYVSLHAPLNDDTAGLLTRARIGAMKPAAVLINVSRGGLVESLDAVLEGLEDGPLAAAGLDVFPDEPPDFSHPLFKHPRCLFAPHLLGVSTLAMGRIYRSMATDMVTVLGGGRPVFCVNPEVYQA